MSNDLHYLDDDQCVAYLNQLDKTIPNLDVVDDYRNERKEVQACRGTNFPFSYGDVGHSEKRRFDFLISVFCYKYVVKILMGGIDSWFDDWDEKRAGNDGYQPSHAAPYSLPSRANPKNPYK